MEIGRATARNYLDADDPRRGNPGPSPLRHHLRPGRVGDGTVNADLYIRPPQYCYGQMTPCGPFNVKSTDRLKRRDFGRSVQPTNPSWDEPGASSKLVRPAPDPSMDPFQPLSPESPLPTRRSLADPGMSLPISSYSNERWRAPSQTHLPIPEPAGTAGPAFPP